MIIVYLRNIFATIRLQSFSTNIDENEVCTKDINQISKKIDTSSFLYRKGALLAWLINYFKIGNLFCDYYVLKNFSENKNHDVHETFKVTIKFGAYIFLHWYLKKKKNCKHKYNDVKVKCLKQWSTLGLLLKPGLWPRKTRLLKNMDVEKHRSWEIE